MAVSPNTDPAPKAHPPGTATRGIVNAMSIDVEDYFHVSAFEGIVHRTMWEKLESRVERNTARLLDIFDEYAVRSTFFVLGWVGERHPALVKSIVARGHEIASHGYAHRLIYDQTPTSFREDVRKAKQILEDASGRRVGGYRAPSYSVTPRSLWALDVLIEEGYEYDSSIYPIRHDRYGIPVSARHPYVIRRPSGEIVEVPASTTIVGPLNLPIGGGGYFRLLPYWWTRWGISRVNQVENRPTIFYLHPWEIDPDQPRLAASRLSRYRHYRHLEKTEARLRQLLTDFRFDAMETIVADLRAATSGSTSVAFALPYQW